MSESEVPLELAPSRLWLTVLPLATIIAGGILMQAFGSPADFGVSAKLFASPSPALAHAEAAGRIRALATWLLLTAASGVCIYYFFAGLRRFDRPSARLLLRFYLLFSIVGMGFTAFGLVGSGERMIGESAICRSLSLADGPHNPNSCPGETRTRDCAPLSLDAWLQRADRLRGTRALHPRCTDLAPRFELLRWLNLIQRLLLPWVSPALVLGAISCLAAPGRAQARRLNTYLYLTATLLVCGLLFLAALLQWPSFGFEASAATLYKAHVSAWTLYWSIVYTLFIASYYIPVALTLARESSGSVVLGRNSPKDGEGTEKSLGPFDIAMIALGVFAPAITGLLGDIIKI